MQSQMEKNIENKMRTAVFDSFWCIGFRVQGLGFSQIAQCSTLIMENSNGKANGK